MSDEKKPQEQSPAPAAPQAQAVPQTQAAAEVKAPQAAQAKKNKKISQMSIKEVDEKLNLAKEKMGWLDSRYAKELLKRKEILLSNNKV